MKSKWLVVSSVLAFSMIFSVSIEAQDQGAARGNLSGIVYDASKASVPGAQVTITGPIGSLSQSTTEQGSFLFSTLIPGSYSIKVQKAGFKIASVKSAEVLYALDAYTRRPQSRFVGSATRAAVCELAVNDHRGDAADAVLLRPRGPRTLVHVHHLHVTRRTRDSVHERDRLLTDGAPRTENLDLPLGTHDATPLAL